MRWTFIGVWIIAVISISSFVWLMRVPTSNQHVYYTSVISESDAINQLTVFGKTWIEQEATVVPLTDGNVVDVLVRPGDLVKAGDVLASLDIHIEDLKEFDKLKALSLETSSMDKLNLALKEVTRLEVSGYYDVVEASKKRSEIYSSISDIMSYRMNLKKQYDETYGKVLRAPFDGIVTDVRLKKGQRVSVRDLAADISVSVAPHNYTVGVELEVSDELLFKMKIGQEILVSVPLSHNSSFKGTINAISHQAYDDRKKRFFKVLGVLNQPKNSKLLLASGMKVVVDVSTTHEDNLTWIPKAALDIFIEESLITNKLSFVHKQNSRSLASTKGDDFKAEDVNKMDTLTTESNASRLVANKAFPLQSSISEIYLLTADNKVVLASIQKVRESGEMIAVEGKDLRGMRVITHYRPKDTLW